MKWFLSTLQQLSVLCSCEAVKVIDAQCTESNVCLATGIAAKTLPHRSPLVTHRSGPMRAQAWALLNEQACALICWAWPHFRALSSHGGQDTCCVSLWGSAAHTTWPLGFCSTVKSMLENIFGLVGWSFTSQKYLYNGETPIGFSIQPMYRLIYGVTKMFVNVGCHLLQLSTRCPIHQN